MRGDEFLPAGDWATRDSLAEMTAVYERPEAPQGSAPLQLQLPAPRPSPVVVAPIAYVPMQRFEIPTLAPYVVGSSPQVRISERLDATHRVERASSWHGQWQRMALIAGIVGAIATGVAVGVVVSLGGTELDAAPAAVQRITRGPTVTPIEVPAPAKRVVLAPVPDHVSEHVAARVFAPAAEHDTAPQRTAHREPRHEHAAAPAPVVATGTLRIASKPPCAIAVDGKPSGKTTPQVALALPAGSHQITLTNEEQGIQLTTEISIKADKSTSIVQDFTK